MTSNNYLNIKEINNWKWANKLGPSLKKTRLETILHKTSLVQGNAKALLIKNYSINSAKWTYCSFSFSKLPEAFRTEEWNDGIDGHRGAYFHLPIKSNLCVLWWGAEVPVNTMLWGVFFVCFFLLQAPFAEVLKWPFYAQGPVCTQTHTHKHVHCDFSGLILK